MILLVSTAFAITSCGDLSDSLTSGLSGLFDNIPKGLSDDLIQEPTDGYNITYYFNNGTGTSTEVQVKKDTKVMLLTPDEAAVPAGKKFAGWVRDKEHPTVFYFGEQDLGRYAQKKQNEVWEIKLYAHWINKDTFVLIYKRNAATSGELPVSQTKELGKDLKIAMNSGCLTREGYGFFGWNTKADGSGTHYDAGIAYAKDEDMILYAEWLKGTAISRIEDFQKMRDDLTGTFILQRDLELPKNFQPIGRSDQSFRGTFIGEGHTLSNLRIVDTSAKMLGFFVRLKEAKIYDLTFKNPYVEGMGSDIGTSIPNPAPAGLGVLAGYVSGGGTIIRGITIEGVDSEVRVVKRFAGLLIGRIEGNTGVYAVVENCSVSGKLDGEYDIGGLLGYARNTDIKKSEAEVRVKGTMHLGGLVGIQVDSSITKSCATGVVAGTSSYIGGIVGWQLNSTINQSYSTSDVSGIGSLGGLVGLQASCDISNSYAVGKASNTGAATQKIGGLLGSRKGGVITNSYFDSRSTGQSKGMGVVSGGTGMPIDYAASDLTGSDKFLGWDFTGMNGKPAIWHWVGTGKWPILQWQYEMQQAP
ncbi:hypothetical protein LSH36_793g01276 [Paralvinella palmiformis]|uniref:GLUG domain-containing protein n=1 Tax=Paralvinella palmiformis TaxID=53620 RepID=A0AAD9J0F0_9ANNE|nr:hypothetical protein LSH36_793g01276 [Paralvinella palmiformis]